MITHLHLGDCDFPKLPEYDDILRQYLTYFDIQWRCLDVTEHKELEAYWRSIYGRAFRGRPRIRHGNRADHEYLQINDCTHYWIVSFTSGVDGLPVHVRRRYMGAYECWGELIPMGAFCAAEFFVCPSDFSWTMVHDHEDHALGGPYFLRKEWIP